MPQTAPEVAAIARSASARLAEEHGESLVPLVERELAGDGAAAPGTFGLDPVSVAALIVSVAALVWTIYRDLKKDGKEPQRDALSRKTRIALREERRISPEKHEQVIELVIDETMTQGQASANS